jgi:phosphate/sulfate permease
MRHLGAVVRAAACAIFPTSRVTAFSQGFEFVNGFHDTANAVATVIYTRSLPENVAVVWSGMFNLRLRVFLKLLHLAHRHGTVERICGGHSANQDEHDQTHALLAIVIGATFSSSSTKCKQGACAEITAAATIAAADGFGLPVSTTHVLSSGISGTMAANGSGLQLATVRNIALAWVLTLPAAMIISGSLYWIFLQLS